MDAPPIVNPDDPNTKIQVSDYIASIIYDRAQGLAGDTGLEAKLWQWQGENDKVQHLLDTAYNVAPAQPEVTTGSLVITKTIEGQVTPEEAAGALRFKVTAPDGTAKEYTLADFTLADGKYTLTITDAQAGDYTVEETAYDIDGNTVTITCSVDGEAATKGTKATAKVDDGTTATVDFKDAYTKKETPKTPGTPTPNDPDNGDDKAKPKTPGSENTAGDDGGKATTEGDGAGTAKTPTAKATTDKAATTKASTDKKDNPLTGDNVTMILVATIAMAISGGIILISNNRKKAYRPKHARTRR